MNYSKDGVTVAAMFDTAHPKKSGKCPVKSVLPTIECGTIIRLERIYRRRNGKYCRLQGACTCGDPQGHRKQLPDRAGGCGGAGRGRRIYTQQTEYAAKRCTLRHGKHSISGKMEELNKLQHVGNMLIYDNVLKGLERFAGTRIRFETITVSWLEKYAAYLREEGKRQTTIAIHLRTLRAILNEAKRQGAIKEAQYPFGLGKDKYKYNQVRGAKWLLHWSK